MQVKEADHLPLRLTLFDKCDCPLGGGQPSIIIWENVPGAFSSNSGADFRAVLEEIAEAEIPVPEGGKWAEAGMVELPDRQIAWRCLDAQFWGVPQRRKRIFLVCDFAGRRAGKILFERQGVSGNTSESSCEGQGIAGTVKNSTGNASSFIAKNSAKARSIGYAEELSPTIDTDGSVRVITKEPLTFTVGNLNRGADPRPSQNGICATLRASYNDQSPCVLYDMTHANEVIRPVKPNIAPTLNSRMGTGGNQVPLKLETYSVDMGGGKSYVNIGKNISSTITTTHGGAPAITVNTETYQKVSGPLMANSHPYTGQDAYSDMLITQPAYSLQGNVVDRNSHQHGFGINKEVAPTLNTQDKHAVAAVDCRNLRETPESGTLQAKENGGQSLNYTNPVRLNYKVRRLTPTECERLQGLPDGYTDVPLNGKPATDTNRYKACGNGMAQPCADFVMEGVAREKIKEGNK